MKSPSFNALLAASTFLLAVNHSLAIIELNVVSIIPPTVGDASGTGTTVAANVNDRARFNLILYDTVADTTRTATLQVTLISKGAGLTDHWISTGQDGNTDRVGIALFGAATDRIGTYEFSFFNTTAFTTPLPLDGFVMQVSDIDQVESVNVSSIRFPTIDFSAGTQLTQTPLPGDRTVVANIVGENISKTEPTAVANFTSIANVSTFLVILEGKTSLGGREFQFDFTPDIQVVPEPAAYAGILGLVALTTVFSFRRRR